MIKLENVVKVYRTTEVETTALNGIDLTVQAGEFLALMGPSGCGKSTLLNIIGLIDSPSAGSYSFFGQDVSAHSEDALSLVRKQNVGFIFQQFNLIDELSVHENVELALRYHKVAPKERRERAIAALDQVGMSKRLRHFPRQLSGGQQQRVAIARALVGRPKVIVADEPTGNLDAASGAQIMELMKGAHQSGATLVMVTHSDTCATHADRVLSLLDGKLVHTTIPMQPLQRQVAANTVGS